jgi:hypothetical protein
MDREGVVAVIRGLNSAQVRYLVAGGLAVVAHGHVRFTADLDLILDMDEGNLRRAIRALCDLGYRPRAPVDILEFASAEARGRWVREKGLTVFSLSSPRHSMTEVDLFAEPPLDFPAAYARAARLEVAPQVTATFVGRDDLIAMKERAGRPQDLDDIEHLRRLDEGSEREHDA